MTRENKLALIVGFGLILLVGILVSDYLSESQRPDQAELGGVVDPLSDQQQSDDLIQFMEPRENDLLPRQNRHMVSNEGTMSYADGGPTGRQAGLEEEVPRRPNNGGFTGGDIEIGGTNGNSSPLTKINERRGGSGAAPSWTHHHVRSSETLTSICKDYFNTSDYAVVLKLAEYNDLENPDSLREGRRLRIPGSLEALDRGLAATDPDDDNRPVRDQQTRGNDRAPSAPTRTYTVRDNDTLSEIASREMGSAKHWRKLYEANKDKIKNPDRLIPGTVLQIPKP